MKKYIGLIVVLFFINNPFSNAQTLRNLISEENNFHRIESISKKYFQNKDLTGNKEYKHYQRWKGEMQYHIDPNGVVGNVNALQYAAWKKLQKSQPLNRATHGQWNEVGPFDYTGGDVYTGGGVGRTNCTAFHPSNANIFWVGSANGGLWKTTNGGEDWTPMAESLGAIGISGIVVDQSSPDIIYILTGDGDGSGSNSGINRNASIGVMKTTDGGLNWHHTDLNLGIGNQKYGYKLMSHPLNPNILFAVFAGLGIFRTDDGGDQWDQVEPGRTVWDIEIDVDTPDRMYAASEDGFLISVDGGITWVIDHDSNFPVPSENNRMAIAVSPANPSTVYAVVGGGTGVNGTFQGVYKSTNNGANFSMQSNTPNILGSSNNGGNGTDQAWYDLCIVVDPNNDNRVFVGGVNCWRSDNGGVTWDRKTWWTRNFEPVDPYVHADWHNMYFNGNTMYANVDGGIYKTADLGGSWDELTKGMSIMQIYEMSIRDGKYLVGSQDNGTNEADDTDTQCHNILGGDGFGAIWNAGNTNVQYLTTQDRLARREAGSNVFIWEEGNGFWRSDLKMHRTDNDYFFFDKGSELFRASQNGILIWDFNFDSLKTRDILLNNREILGFDQGSGSGSGVMYVVNDTTLIKTDFIQILQPPWVRKTNPTGGAAYLSDVVVNPFDAEELWVSCSGYNANHKVHVSYDGGDSFMNITGSLPNVPVRCIIHDQTSKNGLYVGMDIGVFFRNDDMTDWIYFSNQMPNTRVTDLELSGGNIYAATYGRGVWKSTAYSSCLNTVVLTPGNDPSNPLSIGEQHYHAGTLLISTRTIEGNAEVYYNSGSYMDMRPGFVAKKNTFWEAKIEGCPE